MNLYELPHFVMFWPDFKGAQVFLNQLGDNCIQNFHLGRYIVGYKVGNFSFTVMRKQSGKT